MTNKIFSRKSLLPLVAGVLIGATVGGVGIVVAAATTNTVTGCANKTTGILRYAADGKCKSKIENKIEWNQAGAAGAAGVTGSGFIVLASTLAAIKVIPLEGLALLIGVDRFMSEARSVTNFIGNAVATVVISKHEKSIDMEVFKKVVGV